MSWQMEVIGLLKRATSKRAFSRPDGADALLTRAKGDPTPPSSLGRRVSVTTERVEGADVVTLLRTGTPAGTRPVVVHLHGGAYVNEVVKQHWTFAADLAVELDVEVQVPLYGLAPDHDAAEGRALVHEVLRRLRDQGRDHWLSGDSAGGGLALVVAQQLVASGDADSLRGLTLIAPWLDLTMSHPDLPEAERRDPWLARAALHGVAASWAGGTALDDPLVSPGFGEVAGLPPVHLVVGTRDMTLPDCRELARRLRAAGVDTTYVEEPGALHVLPLLPTPEGRRSAGEVRGRIALTMLRG